MTLNVLKVKSDHAALRFVLASRRSGGASRHGATRPNDRVEFNIWLDQIYTARIEQTPPRRFSMHCKCNHESVKLLVDADDRSGYNVAGVSIQASLREWMRVDRKKKGRRYPLVVSAPTIDPMVVLPFARLVVCQPVNKQAQANTGY